MHSANTQKRITVYHDNGKVKWFGPFDHTDAFEDMVRCARVVRDAAVNRSRMAGIIDSRYPWWHDFADGYNNAFAIVVTWAVDVGTTQPLSTFDALRTEKKPLATGDSEG